MARPSLYRVPMSRHGPFWSADSRSVGFFAAGKLKRIDIDGGAVAVLADAPLGEGGPGTRMARSFSRLFPRASCIKFRPPVATPVAVTNVAAPTQVGHSFPEFLPDGRHFLFYVVGAPDVRGIYVGELGSSETKRLLDADAGGSIRRVRPLAFRSARQAPGPAFDARRLSLSGDPFEVAGEIATRGLITCLVGLRVRADRLSGWLGSIRKTHVVRSLRAEMLEPWAIAKRSLYLGRRFRGMDDVWRYLSVRTRTRSLAGRRRPRHVHPFHRQSGG